MISTDDERRAWLSGRLHRPLAPSRASIDAVFVDRDGTINVHAPGYRTKEDFVLLDGAAQAIARLNAAGIPVILVTNQRGLSTGALTWHQLIQVHQLMVDHLAAVGAHLDDIRLCPHEEGTCHCRKPLPGLLTDVLSENPHLRAPQCVMYGDTQADADAAAAARVPFDKVTSGETLASWVNELLDHDMVRANNASPPVYFS